MQLTHPSLIITIDTEEGFDWNKPFSRNNHSIETLYDHDTYMSHIYKKFNIQPVALISYPILNNLSCQELLKKWRDEGLYLLGTHLHSWVTPPFEEELSNFNSFASNLSFELREKKLKTLTKKFIEVLGYQPRYYKCGRYGICNSTYEILEKLNYQYDFSPFAKRNFSHIQGENFSHIQNKPYFSPNNSRIKIFPITADYTGFTSKNSFFHKIYQNSFLKKYKIQGIMSRLNILDFITLSPEGITALEMQKLTKQLLTQGQKYFHLAYHSSSFTINQSPYCKSNQDAQIMSDKINDYIQFFIKIGGKVSFQENNHDILNMNPQRNIINIK